jgi:hypothetical protein
MIKHNTILNEKNLHKIPNVQFLKFPPINSTKGVILWLIGHIMNMTTNFFLIIIMTTN